MAKRKRKQIDDDLKQTREKLAELEAESRRADMTPEQEAALDDIERLQSEIKAKRAEIQEARKLLARPATIADGAPA